MDSSGLAEVATAPPACRLTDPPAAGAPGLQTCPDGRPKIIDTVECTGSGDVDTSVVRKAGADGTIEGLAGRALRPSPSFRNPSGEWHVGAKLATELYSKGLEKRMAADRRKQFNREADAAEAEARRAVAAFDREHDEAEVRGSRDLQAQKKDLEDRVEALTSARGAYEDEGPVYDCLVWHDGDAWRAAVDTTETGDFADAEAMTNFKVERQWSTLSERDSLNYALNIYDDGNTLSIVTDAGAHGTHVAGIVGAHFDGHPEASGVAPGVQIVAVKIGDTRLGSMETAVGLSRGLRAVVENKCDLINMSYGEPTAVANAGAFIEMAREVVNKHGVIFVASAGNNGPCLSTVGAPGGTTDALFGIGAMVSPAMMSDAYSMHHRVPSVNYTWSSRGPSADGALGVCVSAPGGAISPVPNWTLQANQLMNGTSMSSPNACGCLALVLSGLKASGVPYTPWSIRRSIECTARPIAGSDVFGLGHGLLQVDAAFDHAVSSAKFAYPRFDVKISGGGRGIYLRNGEEAMLAREHTVFVSPKFHEDEPQASKIALDLRVTLVSTAAWVQAASHLMLNNGGRSFQVFVDPTALPPGAHYAEVRGYDAANPSGGPIFRVPVSVLRPLEEGSFFDFGSLQSSPGKINRFMLATPPGASWVDIALHRQDSGAPLDVGTLEREAASRGGGGGADEAKGAEDGARGAGAASDVTDYSTRLIVLHALQLVPGKSIRYTETEKYLRMLPDQREVVSMAVTPGLATEIVVAQYWSSLGACQIGATVTFHGVTPVPRTLALHSAETVTRVDVVAELEPTKLQPTAKLTHWEQPVLPSSAEIRALGPRDNGAGADEPAYELLLSYTFKQAKAGSVVVHTRTLTRALYESVWGGQLMLVCDSNKRLVGVSDAFPDPIKLEAGSYTIRTQVRDSSVSVLGKLKQLPVLIKRKLDKDITVSAHASLGNAARGGGTMRNVPVRLGSRTPVYFAAPGSGDMPSGVSAGDRLVGHVTYVKTADAVEGEGKTPQGFPVTYAVGPRPPKSGKGGASASKPADKRTEEEKAAEEVRDARIKALGELSGKAAAAELAALLSEHPRHLPLHVAAIKAADATDGDAVSAAVEALIAAIDLEALASITGTRLPADTDPQSDAAVAFKKAKEDRDTLVDALFQRAKALATRSGLGGKLAAGREQSAADDAFVRANDELQRWVDTSKADKYKILAVESALVKGHLGTALVAVNGILKAGEEAAGKVSCSITAWSPPPNHSRCTPPLQIASVDALRSLRSRLYAELGFDFWAKYEALGAASRKRTSRAWPRF